MRRERYDVDENNGAEATRPEDRGELKVVLRVDSLEPFVGRVNLDDGAEEPFQGWLDFLGALSRLLELPPD